MDRYYISRQRLFEDYSDPFGWWGGHWSPPVPLSVVQIMESGSMNARLIALAWQMMAAHQSILFSSEPPMAGKSTTLTAFLDFIPQAERRVYLRGMYENFQFERDGKGTPTKSWLLVNEMSNHLPTYCWGNKAQRMLNLQLSGYAVGATMHANTAEEAVAQLGTELGIAAAEIAQFGLLFIIRVYNARTGRMILDEYDMPYGNGAVVRRVATGHTVSLDDKGRLLLTPLAEWQQATDHHEIDLTAALPILAQKTGQSAEQFTADLDKREAYITELCSLGVRSIGAVKDAINKFKL